MICLKSTTLEVVLVEGIDKIFIDERGVSSFRISMAICLGARLVDASSAWLASMSANGFEAMPSTAFNN